MKDHSSGTEEEFKSDSENASFEISDDSEPEPEKKEKGSHRFPVINFDFRTIRSASDNLPKNVVSSKYIPNPTQKDQLLLSQNTRDRLKETKNLLRKNVF